MGMVLGIGRRDAQDGQESPPDREVPYRMASYEHDHEGKRFRSSDVVYSFWSASKYVLVLSIILWWLPMFGQMIAGYVGGRRAGGPWRGVAASILPVACLYIVMTGFDSGFFPSHVFGVAIAPAAIGASLGESIPFISPYIQFSSEYVGSFVDALAGASPYGINTYVLTVAFAYVGGILAEQSRREIEFTSGSMMSNTTVLVSDNNQNYQHPHLASRGLAHMIGSAFPWSHANHEDGAVVEAHMLQPRGHGSWSKAVPMRYTGEDDRRVRSVPALPAGPPGEDGRVFSSASTRKLRSRKAHSSAAKSKGKRQDPWVRADRRARKHYSSARRLKAPEDDYDDAHEEVKSRQRKVRSSAPRIVPGDGRSIRRARKSIDRAWGRRDFPVLNEHSRRPSHRAREPEDEEAEPGPPQSHHRPNSDHWDTI